MYKISLFSLIIFLILSNYITLQQGSQPSPSIKCYQCNSYENVNCAVNPSTNLSDVMCSANDTCVTTIVEDITYRGCSSNFQSFNNLTDHCNTDLCNNKIYPANRLRCYKCPGGKDCVNSPSTAQNIEACLYYDENDQCFTDVIDETDAVRGCLSDRNYTSGPYVKLCSENGCNNQMGVGELKCISCSSKNSRGCKRPAIINGDINKCKIYETNNCTVQTLLGRPTESCFIYHKLDTVIRGCTRFSGLLQNEIKHFHECKGDFCNQNCLDPLKCYDCNSATTADCMKGFENLTLTNCKSEDSSCHTCEYEDNSLSRGCGNPQSVNCYQCDDSNGCNLISMQRCYNCTSETDPNCATWEDESEIAQQICPSPSDSCVTFTTRNGHTQRGCLSELNFDCNFKPYCQDCTGNLCNSGIFPKDRFKCHQCVGLLKSDDKCAIGQAENSSKLLPCRKNLEIDGCFAYVDYESQTVVRGCLSDIKEYDRCELLDNKCIQCDESKCNSHELLKPSKLSCIKCNSIDGNNPACIWGQKMENLKKCESYVPFYLKESCFMYSNNSRTFIKGCSVDERICDQQNNADQNCQICDDSNGCNRKSFKIQYCLACNSTYALGCVDLSSDYHTKCNNAPYISYDQHGCYTRRHNNVTFRGCATDLSLEELDQCKKFNGSKTDDTFCQYCDGQDCNIIDTLPNSNMMSEGSIILILLCVIVQRILK